MHSKSRQKGLRGLSEGLLRNVDRVAAPGRVLEIRHPGAPLLSPDCLHSGNCDFGLYLSLNKGSYCGSGQPLVCDTAGLPFQDGVFSMVLLHHAISDGREAELAEAVRVLARDGVLVLVGLNRFGRRFRCQKDALMLPGMAPLKVKSHLDRLDMSIGDFAAAGLFGLRRPVFMKLATASLCLPVTDVILLQAWHNNGPEMTPLKLRKLGSGVVQSA